MAEVDSEGIVTDSRQQAAAGLPFLALKQSIHYEHGDCARQE